MFHMLLQNKRKHDFLFLLAKLAVGSHIISLKFTLAGIIHSSSISESVPPALPERNKNRKLTLLELVHHGQKVNLLLSHLRHCWPFPEIAKFFSHEPTISQTEIPTLIQYDRLELDRFTTQSEKDEPETNPAA